MPVTTWNVSGQRAAVRKGFRRFVRQLKPDVLLSQEVRALPEQLEPREARPRGWSVHWNPAPRGPAAPGALSDAEAPRPRHGGGAGPRGRRRAASHAARGPRSRPGAAQGPVHSHDADRNLLPGQQFLYRVTARESSEGETVVATLSTAPEGHTLKVEQLRLAGNAAPPDWLVRALEEAVRGGGPRPSGS